MTTELKTKIDDLREASLAWSMYYSSPLHGFAAFLRAAGAFGGMVPSHADPAALAAARRARSGSRDDQSPSSQEEDWDVAVLVAAWRAAWAAACVVAPDGPGPSAGRITINSSWALAYGMGRSWVEVGPEGSGVRVTVHGPGEAIDSIVARADAADPGESRRFVRWTGVSRQDLADLGVRMHA